ncbi:MAG: sulfotransferase family protein [Rubrobacter sp.]
MTQQRGTARRSTRPVRGSGEPPHLFIVGCARSGTTLLHRIVDAHPVVAITPEMHWVSEHLDANEARGEPIVTPEVVSELADHKRSSQFELDREDFEGLLAPGETVPYQVFLCRLFELYGRVREKPLVGNKTPAYVRHLPKLHKSWPKARFVHIVRDGRDVCLSVMGWKKAGRIGGRYSTWEEDPVSTIALWWERKVRAGHEAGAALGPGLYHGMRYEDLIRDPERECRALCEFLDLPYDAAMVRFSEGKTRTDLPDTRRTPKKAWLPVTSGLRDWRTEMEVGDVERFEAVAGDLLEPFGYERAFPEPGPNTMEHAARMRESFVTDVRMRAERSPGHQ